MTLSQRDRQKVTGLCLEGLGLVFPARIRLAETRMDVDGRSLAPIWRGEARPSRSHVFTAFGGVMRAVRDERWKLIRYPAIDRTQLFDLQSDPQETNDLAEDPSSDASGCRT